MREICVKKKEETSHGITENIYFKKGEKVWKLLCFVFFFFIFLLSYCGRGIYLEIPFFFLKADFSCINSVLLGMGGRLALKNSVLRWGLGFPSANLFTHWSWCWWRVDWWFSALLRLRCPCPRPRRVVVGGGVVVVDVVVVVVVVVLSRICFPLRWRSAGCATVDLSVRGCAHFNIRKLLG